MGRDELDLAQAPSVVHKVVDACLVARRATASWFDPWAMPAGFDPTALVKGWAARRTMEALRHGGISAAMVNAGGDIVVVGEPRPAPCWRIAIVDPHRADHLLGSVALPVSERPWAIATSGRYERGEHLLDPHTAVGVKAALERRDPQRPVVCLATAHPAKFGAAVAKAIGSEPTLPPALADLASKESRCTILDADTDMIRDFIARNALK